MPFPIIPGGSPASTSYQVSRSLRFRSSANPSLVRTPSTTTNTNLFTISFWVKFGTVGASSANYLFDGFSSSTQRFYIGRLNDYTLQIYQVSAGTQTLNFITTAVFRDSSAWYHIVVAINSSATGTQKCRLWVNGVENTVWTSSVNASFTSSNWNANNQHDIGAYGGASGYSQDGYLAEVYNIDGQALTPSSFGQSNALTGVWEPKQYTGTYGTNGFYLPFNTVSLSTDLTSTATLTAPFGGTANNAKVADGAYVISNTTTGSTFTHVQQDFGSATQLTRFSITNLYFTGGTSTWQVQYGNDNTWTTYSVAASLSVTGSAQNFTGNINGFARYVRLTPISFGANGQGYVDAFIIYQDGIGLDSSGNGNNWTPNNISVTSGTTYDSMIDSPTNYADGGNGRGNYCTFNPLVNSSTTTVSGGNLNYTASTGYDAVCTQAPNYKCYFEMTVIAASGTTPVIGMGDVSVYNPWVNNVYSANGGFGTRSTGVVFVNGTSGSTYATYTTNNVVGFAFDPATGKFWYSVNGVWANSGDPDAGTGNVGTATVGLNYVPLAYAATSNGVNANFGQRPFSYPPSSANKNSTFYAINTQNLPAPALTPSP